MIRTKRSQSFEMLRDVDLQRNETSEWMARSPHAGHRASYAKQSQDDELEYTAAICKAAVADTLAAIERATARIESAQTLSADAEAALVRRVEQAGARVPAGPGAAAGCSHHADGGMAVATLLGAAGGGCFWLGRRTAAIEDAQLAALLRDRPQDATALARLMEANPGLVEELQRAPRFVDQATGREAATVTVVGEVSAR
jgi:hypothetical protein